MRNIDFSIKGPFGILGPKLKHQIEMAKIAFLNKSVIKSNSVNDKDSEKKNDVSGKFKINPYYSLTPPGS